MNAKEFSALYAQKCGITKALAEDYCKAFTELLEETFDGMDAGDRLTFYGFGTFAKKRKPAHVIGDIKTGGRIEIPAKDRIVFTQSKADK